MGYGLIGEKLSHSFSKIIHEKLADYTYTLYPLNPQEFEQFMEKREFTAINVTIPYKQQVIAYCDSVDPKAKAIGAVNTIVNKDGKLTGYNTDYDGFAYMLRRHGIELKGRKVLILGNGGTTKTVAAVAKDAKAAEVKIASRKPGKKTISYQQAVDTPGIQVIINASPVGMYPHNGQAAIEVKNFPSLEAVVDVIYNPIRSKLVLDAQRLGIPATGGLEMLIAQAKYAAEYFMEKPVKEEEIERIRREMLGESVNIVLTGMPGCGKTSLGKALAEKLGRKFVDIDHCIVQKEGRSIPDIFAEDGEEYFRKLEELTAAELGKETGLVIATGGGLVKRQTNVESMRQNGMLIFINCPAEDLKLGTGRPLAKCRNDLQKLEEERLPIYRSTADCEVVYHPKFEENVKRVYDAWEEQIAKM